MDRDHFLRIARRLMSQPAAPFHEHGVRAEVERICEEEGLLHERDEFGNMIVRAAAETQGRALALAAHMDHPGFEIVRTLSDDTAVARFLGGVGDAYFKSDIPLLLMPGQIPARLSARQPGPEREFLVKTETASAAAAFAVWDLVPFMVEGNLIHGRACDDLIGVATILAVLMELKKQGSGANVIGIITRAEEVGFLGALALAASKTLSPDTFIISLETSRELPGVTMGSGVILRVGDRSSIFNSEGTRFLNEVGIELNREGFKHQRALMSGGTCEATAFQELGYQTAGVCVALGNYHNCAGGSEIAPEYINIDDTLGMAQLLVAAAGQMVRFDELVKKLPDQMQKLLKEAREKLPISSD